MQNELQGLRVSIDQIDATIVRLLAERFQITRKIGVYKKANNLPAVDAAREKELLASIESQAQEAGLDPKLATSIFRLIIDTVVKQHGEA